MKKEDGAIFATNPGIPRKPVGSCMLKHQFGKGKNLQKNLRNVITDINSK